MTDRLRLWWKARSLREQRLLVVMAALAIVTLVWLGLLRPLADARAEARARHGEMLVAVAEVEVAAEWLKTLAAADRPRLSGSAVEAIRAETDAIAITPSRVERDGAGVRVDIPMIGAGALFSLIDRLRARGLSIDTLAARPEAGGTLVVTMRLEAERQR